MLKVNGFESGIVEDVTVFELGVRSATSVPQWLSL